MISYFSVSLPIACREIVASHNRCVTQAQSAAGSNLNYEIVDCVVSKLLVR